MQTADKQVALNISSDKSIFSRNGDEFKGRMITQSRIFTGSFKALESITL